jgi:hypothetical protein
LKNSPGNGTYLGCRESAHGHAHSDARRTFATILPVDACGLAGIVLTSTQKRFRSHDELEFVITDWKKLGDELRSTKLLSS